MSAANILLVDDNDDVREITALLLSDNGYNVVEAANGQAALCIVDRNPGIDLLIVDEFMPEMSGIELVERARSQRPELKAIFITGNVNHRRLSGKFPDEIVLKKPFSMDQLVFAVRNALNQPDDE
jgi:DNA-binding NtrC family response regulator